MKMFKIKNSTKGFTLIELLVVIAIIGILSSVVLASLNSARKNGRDARRVADIKQIQLALELYFDANPTTGYPVALTGLVSNYMQIMPKDPSTQANYSYVAIGSSTNCSSYHLGATLEVSTNIALPGVNANSTGSSCQGVGGGFDGTAALVYDVKP